MAGKRWALMLPLDMLIESPGHAAGQVHDAPLVWELQGGESRRKRHFAPL